MVRAGRGVEPVVQGPCVEPFDADAVALEGVQHAALGADAVAEVVEQWLEDVLGEFPPHVLHVLLVAISDGRVEAGVAVRWFDRGDVPHEPPR